MTVKVFRDGREVCTKTVAGRKEYARRREFMWERDKGICCICGEWVAKGAATTEHPQGRGMGGSRRDDRVENCGIAHWRCNAEKGSKRI